MPTGASLSEVPLLVAVQRLELKLTISSSVTSLLDRCSGRNVEIEDTKWHKLSRYMHIFGVVMKPPLQVATSLLNCYYYLNI